MPLINCKINLILTWSANSVIVSTNVANQNAIFIITDTKLYVPVVNLSTQDNSKLLQQLKSGFKRVINWNEYLSKPELLRRNPNLNHLVKPGFQEVNRLFVLTLDNDTQRKSAKGCYLPNLEVKDYEVMINGENLFHQPVIGNKVTYENIKKTVSSRGNDFSKGYLLDYSYFKDRYKMIVVDLSR